MSKHDASDDQNPQTHESWIREIGRSDADSETPRARLLGRHANAATADQAAGFGTAAETGAVEQSITASSDSEQATADSEKGLEPAPASKKRPVRIPAALRSATIKKPLLIGVAATIGLLTVAAGSMTAMSKDVAIVVDGQTRTVHTMAGTVDGALEAAGLSVGAHDALAPGGSTSISDGSTIVLNKGRSFTLTVNGQQRQVWTTARTADEAMKELGATAAAAQLPAANRARSIPLGGLTVAAATTRAFTVSVGGIPTASGTTSARTVGELLAERKIVVGALDRVHPATGSALVGAAKISVDRVKATITTSSVSIKQPATVKVDDSGLERGVSKVVQPGRAGKQKITYLVTTVNGSPTSKKETSRGTVTTARPTIVHVGTKVPAPGSQVAADEAASKFTYDGVEVFTHDTTFGVNWDGLAMCESTHNPKAVNANPSAGLPTYGLFQFDIPTWASVGGSGNPMDADPAEQLMRAKLLYQQRGLEPWACRDSAH